MSDDWNDWDEEDVEDDSLDDEEKPKKKTSGGTKGHFTAWEDQIIRDEWQTCTDEEIGNRIGRSVESIARRRKILGLSKKNGRPKKRTRKKAIFENPTENSLAKLSKEDRIEFYKTKFDKNPRYQWLIRMLLDDELEYYKIKYIETIDAMDSLTHNEEDILHNMIMKEIMIMRLNSQIKEAWEAYQDRDDDDERRPPPQYLYQDLERAEQQYVKYQEKLKLTREQRLKTDREEKLTVVSVVRDFMDRENRQRAGDIAGQLSFFTEKCREDMLKMQFLLGE